MKIRKLLRISGITLIMVLLLAMVVPAAAVFATVTNQIAVSPLSSTVGGLITVSGTIQPSTEGWINIHMSDSNVAVGTAITAISSYHLVSGADLLSSTDDPTGAISCIFNIPANLTTGILDIPVTTGTYYIYATRVNNITYLDGPILAKATLTVTAPSLQALRPAAGPAGTEVTITGTNFPASSLVTFMLDATTTLTITTGTSTSTDASGIFVSSVTIPTATAAGVHSIGVYINNSATASATASFTVSANPTITLIPTTGAAGSTITIIGASFPASQALSFRFNSATVAITSGDAASSSAGAFTSVITVPAGTAAGSYTVTATAGTATSAPSTYVVTGTTPPPTTTPRQPPHLRQQLHPRLPPPLPAMQF
jgi:hypothetical protein